MITFERQLVSVLLDIDTNCRAVFDILHSINRRTAMFVTTWASRAVVSPTSHI